MVIDDIRGDVLRPFSDSSLSAVRNLECRAAGLAGRFTLGRRKLSCPWQSSAIGLVTSTSRFGTWVAAKPSFSAISGVLSYLTWSMSVLMELKYVVVFALVAVNRCSYDLRMPTDTCFISADGIAEPCRDVLARGFPRVP